MAQSSNSDECSVGSIPCDQCEKPFNPNRETKYEWFNSKRCEFCGYKHSTIAVKNKRTQDSDEQVSQPDSHDTANMLYLITTNGMAKIGVSVNPEKRVKQIQTANPTEVILQKTWDIESAYSTESEIHNKLSNKHERGEWFDISDTTTAQFQKEITSYLEGQKDKII